ncbi:hypothetical protein PPL_00678 [Heterostelium album PN500]|uniref:Uncharacterized protein n=1 Tax=Heterostelium pallidum (strain ATCC 26659 / Pp 5 / PN500) TaxID=670386 RepID=D3AX49_HETP5|nr:hypothetical protein PPL_00678 [Heterostelium album PN500]EFA86118.1 hypothetical protein PPL_00678 [Heterostelium album PN500]|eukprot:XP_020438223.1 hypothetical protein PPL_00678 [Heterostelium album PN500]
MDGKDLKRKSTTDLPISSLMKDDNQTDTTAVKKQKSNHHDENDVVDLSCEDPTTTAITTTNNNNESNREQFVKTLVFRQRYLMRLIMEKVKELPNIRGLAPVRFNTKMLSGLNTPYVTPVVIPEDYKLSGFTKLPNRPIPKYDIAQNSMRYMEIDDISWMCRNNYTALLRYKLERNEPLRLTDVRSTYKTMVTDKRLFQLMYERFPKDLRRSLPYLVVQNITRDMLEFIMNYLEHYPYDYIRALLTFIEHNNLELVEQMLTFQTPALGYQELELVQSSIKSGLAMVKLITPRFRSLYIEYSSKDVIFVNLLETRDLELIDYFQSNFGLVFNQNIYNHYFFNVAKIANKEASNPETIERNEQTIAKVMEILKSNKSIVETNQRLAELERSKYGNGGVPITESDVINMRGYMIRYYPFVMLNKECFLPESDEQLRIVEFLLSEMKETIGRKTMTTLFYAISNGLKQITYFIINKLEFKNIYHFLNLESVTNKCISAAIQTKQFDIVELIFEKWGKILKDNEVLKSIRESNSFAALQLFLKHFPSAILDSKFHCTEVGYVLDNLQAEELGIKCDNIDNNLDFARCGENGLAVIIIAYLNFRKDKFNSNNLEIALYTAAQFNQLAFLQEVHKLMPDYRFKMTKHMRGVQGKNKSAVEYFNDTFKLKTTKPTKKKK